MAENMTGKKKEAKSDKEFSRSNSLPSFFGRLPPDNGDSSIQISILSNPSLGHHAQTPAEEILHTGLFTTVDSTLAEEERISKADLHLLAVIDEWHRAMSIFDKHRDMVRTPFTDNGDTILHIAVSANSINFVEQLVNGGYMTLQDLEIQNNDGNTAFCVAAISGNRDLLQIMMARNENLPGISGKDGMLPVHLAASSGHREIVRLLSSDNLLSEMKYNDIERLFLMTITSDIFDVAFKLFENYQSLLATARTDDNLTALHILARKPSEFSSIHPTGMKLFGEVWIRQLQYNEKSGLIDKSSTVLFDAIQSGNDGGAKLILDMNPDLLKRLKDPNGRSPLHCAVLYRRKSVLDCILYILQRESGRNNVLRAVDSERNNVLHLAASYKPRKDLSRLDVELQRELAWFKKVEESVPRDLRTMKNSNDQTPEDTFYANHKRIYMEVKKEAKGIANFGTPVAALVATVVFAAALIVPGDRNSAWFVIFILLNAAALFTSSASIISFLSIFIPAWSIYKEVIISQTLIKLGLALVLVSVVTMLLSFVAASFLIFAHKFKWVAYVVVSMGVLPIILVLLVVLHKYAGRCLNFLGRLRYFFYSRCQLSCHVYAGENKL